MPLTILLEPILDLERSLADDDDHVFLMYSADLANVLGSRSDDIVDLLHCKPVAIRGAEGIRDLVKDGVELVLT